MFVMFPSRAEGGFGFSQEAGRKFRFDRPGIRIWQNLGGDEPA